MDELALLKNMADGTPLPSAGELAPARARLTAAMAARADTVGTDTMRAGTAAGAEAAASGAGVATMPRRHRRRLAIFGVATIGLAAAIAAVVALGPLEQVGIAPQAASAEQVLLDAAAAAKAQPDAVPRPDQFVYTRREMPSGAWETWYSVDGSRTGQYRMFDDVAHEVSPCDAAGPDTGCSVPPAYDPDLPTDAAGIRAYLTNKADNNGGDNGKLYLGRALDLLDTKYVRPASRAALFEVLASADGFTVVEHAVDGAGRPGVGVRLAPDSGLILVPGGGVPILVFDKESHAYLGLAGGDGTEGLDAVVSQAVVDEVGQTE
jgi:hypothetical protein